MVAQNVALGAGVGATGGAAVQVIAGYLVPVAMSYFGTVVSGVGTLHAAGGVAATLQTIAAASVTTVAVPGALVGAATLLLRG